jgi:hypothetical protein
VLARGMVAKMFSEIGHAMLHPPKDWFGRYLIGLLWAVVLFAVVVVATLVPLGLGWFD